MSNVDVALRLMNEIPTGRFSPELLQPDFTAWTITFGDLEGAAYLGAMGRMAALFSPPLQITVVGVTDGGDRVAIEADSAGTLPDGTDYANHYHFLFAFAFGRVSEIREYLDTAPIGRIRAAQAAQAAQAAAH